MRTVRLIENFNFTWQAEGPDSGKKMLLLRFKRCNRSCIWCDTNVKMKMVQEAEYSIQDIQSMVEENNLGVMITGGEPTFGLNLSGTIDIINNTKSYLYNVETNGIQLPELISAVHKYKNIKYILSPKLFNKTDLEFYVDLTKKIKDNDKVFIKLVYEGSYENSGFLNFLQQENFDNNRIWLMPQGKTRDEIIKNSPKVFDAAEKYKTNFSSREHIIFDFV